MVWWKGEPTTPASYKRATIGACLCLYLAACFSPAMSFDGEKTFGIEVLLEGWCAAAQWYANPLLLLGMLLFLVNRFRFAAACGLLGFILGFSVFFFSIGMRLCVGYFLWLSSFAVLAAGAAFADRFVLAFANLNSGGESPDSCP
jgi:hypothetical protein